jgi:aspartyl-tRNA(Asn)/glutamyl-tRNA(Gln) amidotransferase subunit B
MTTTQTTYEIVVGLEVHAQLSTTSKLFSGDATSFGAAPNTHTSPIILGHPGTLPKMNEKAIEMAVKMGIVCHSEIEEVNYFARKHYFYPDLPKGYQVSQHTTPICKGGYVTIRLHGETKNIQLNRIHLEEDAGKSIHDLHPSKTCLDYNRAGVTLIEIVTDPVIRSSEEAFYFVTELRKLVRWIGICDGNMEEGSLRCDANISVRPLGATWLGTKVEIKNLNSIRNVKKAIEIEAARLIKLSDAQLPIIQETRGFNAEDDTTYSIRTKEDADDYRYFPEPDLTPFIITPEKIESYRLQLPLLPEEWIVRLMEKFQLPAYDARIIGEDDQLVQLFVSIATHSTAYKAIANWLIGPLKSYCNEQNCSISSISITFNNWAKLITMVENGELSFSVAVTKVFPKMLENTSASPETIATALNLLQVSNASEIEQWIDAVLLKMPEKVAEFKKGKKGLIGLFVGEVKKISNGKADPKIVTDLLLQKLNQA